MEPTDRLTQLLEAVHDRKTFFEFVVALADDKRAETESLEPSDPFGRGVRGWENHSIEDYILAARACADRDDCPKTPSWKWVAMFLYGGKITE